VSFRFLAFALCTNIVYHTSVRLVQDVTDMGPLQPTPPQTLPPFFHQRTEPVAVVAPGPEAIPCRKCHLRKAYAPGTLCRSGPCWYMASPSERATDWKIVHGSESGSEHSCHCTALVHAVDGGCWNIKSKKKAMCKNCINGR
jgi:hypothetical protein